MSKSIAIYGTFFLFAPIYAASQLAPLVEYSERAVLPHPDGVIENVSPKLGGLYIPPKQTFQKKAGKQLTGRVEYFKKSGGIMPDGGGEKVHAHRRNLPAGVDTLQVGQRVRFIAVREGDRLEAYDIELIDD